MVTVPSAFKSTSYGGAAIGSIAAVIPQEFRFPSSPPNASLTVNVQSPIDISPSKADSGSVGI